MLHDGLYVGRLLRTGAVDLDPDLNPKSLGRLAAFDQRFANLLESLFGGNAFWQTVWPNLHAGPADVVNQLDELLTRLDILVDDGWVRRMKFTHATAAPEDDAGVGESLL